MFRSMAASLILLALAGAGWGCSSSGGLNYGPALLMNPAHLMGQHGGRILYEAHQLHLDVDRLFFGIDYPGGEAESPRQRYYGMVPPGAQPSID